MPAAWHRSTIWVMLRMYSGNWTLFVPDIVAAGIDEYPVNLLVDDIMIQASEHVARRVSTHAGGYCNDIDSIGVDRVDEFDISAGMGPAEFRD